MSLFVSVARSAARTSYNGHRPGHGRRRRRRQHGHRRHGRDGRVVAVVVQVPSRVVRRGCIAVIAHGVLALAFVLRRIFALRLLTNQVDEVRQSISVLLMQSSQLVFPKLHQSFFEDIDSFAHSYLIFARGERIVADGGMAGGDGCDDLLGVLQVRVLLLLVMRAGVTDVTSQHY